MKQFVTIARVRSLMAGAHTEAEASAILRRHRIRYTFSTTGGTFHIRIPSRSGFIRIIRTASRSAPLSVTLALTARIRSANPATAPATCYPGFGPIIGRR